MCSFVGTVLLLMYRKESEPPPPTASNEPRGTGIPLTRLGSSAKEHVNSLKEVLEIPYQRIITFIFRPQVRPNAMMPHAE